MKKAIVSVGLMVALLSQGAFALTGQSISVKSSYPLMLNEEYKINAKAKTALTYTSSNPKVVKVVNGVMYGKKTGTAKITIKAKKTSKYKAASKTVTVKVKKFPRNHEPQKRGWFKPKSKKNPFSVGYKGGNATWYAWGRFAEILGKYPTKLCNKGNAVTWYYTTGYKTGQTPKKGAVAVWGKGSKKGGPGHVAVVEKVKSNGDIIISQSSYSTLSWWQSIQKKSNGYNFSDFVFVGFIYQP